jgi:tRNA U55 pseudouridine synthase TruB
MIAKIAIERISRISDTQSFEQYEIIESWRRHTQSSDHLFQTATIEVDVGSGFYIRSLVEDIGKFLDIPTTTLEIERTRYF